MFKAQTVARNNAKFADLRRTCYFLIKSIQSYRLHVRIFCASCTKCRRIGWVGTIFLFWTGRQLCYSQAVACTTDPPASRASKIPAAHRPRHKGMQSLSNMMGIRQDSCQPDGFSTRQVPEVYPSQDSDDQQEKIENKRTFTRHVISVVGAT